MLLTSRCITKRFAKCGRQLHDRLCKRQAPQQSRAVDEAKSARHQGRNTAGHDNPVRWNRWVDVMARCKVVHSEDTVMVEFKGDKRNPEPSMAVIKFPGGHVEVSRTSDGKYWAHVEVVDSAHMDLLSSESKILKQIIMTSSSRCRSRARIPSYS